MTETDTGSDERILIVRYSQGFGRMGGLTETFACTQLEYDALLAWGRYDHGEVLGKHSDITGTFDDTTLRVLVAADSEENVYFVARAIELGLVGGCPYGENIADYISNGEIPSRLVDTLGPERTAKLAALWGFAPEPVDDVESDDASAVV